MSHAQDRENLTKRTIPQMTLTTSPSNPLSPDPRYISPRDTAPGRFEITGNIILTGGTGAIGMATTRALLQHGAKGVMLFDLNTASPATQEKVKGLREDFKDARVEVREVDVTDENRVNAMVMETREVMGSVDALICFAGVVHAAHAAEHSISKFRSLLDINTTASFICAQAAHKAMTLNTSSSSSSSSPLPGTSSPGGRIIFTASISAHSVNYPQPQAAYNTSKGALLQLTKSLAAEWAKDGITVNSVSPGYMDTILNEGEGLKEHRRVWGERNPMGRMGVPEEVAGVVVMLCSRAGSYVNGADILVDGGGSVF